MRARGLLFGATACLGLALAGQSHATVVTFDDAAGDAVLGQVFCDNGQDFCKGQSFSDGGLTFTNLGAGYMGVWDGSTPNSNGTNNIIFCCGPDDIERITQTGGGRFNLTSIELAISWYDKNSTESITINGIPLTITSTLTTYTLDFIGVTEVDISGVASGSGYWTADNIDPIPEPAPLGLLAAGLAGLCMLRRRA